MLCLVKKVLFVDKKINK